MNCPHHTYNNHYFNEICCESCINCEIYPQELLIIENEYGIIEIIRKRSAKTDNNQNGKNRN